MTVVADGSAWVCGWDWAGDLPDPSMVSTRNKVLVLARVFEDKKALAVIKKTP
jgi:hypothetical protein